MYELKNVFDVFLPQLLLYPNPTDPLNGEAANLMMTDKEKFDETVSFPLKLQVRKYVKKYGNLDCIGINGKNGTEENKGEEDGKEAEENGEDKSDAGSELSATSGLDNNDEDDEPMDEDDDQKHDEDDG